MRLAVIVDGIAMTGDRNRYVDRIDRHVTVGYIEGDRCKVFVSILELLGGETHLRGTGIGSFRLCRTAECEVLCYVIEVGV